MPLFYDEQERNFRMWYKSSCLTGSERRTVDPKAEPPEQSMGAQRFFLCYAESQDGINWIRPLLDRFQFQGSTNNNIVKDLSFANRDTAFFNAVKGLSDPNPMRRYKAIGFDTTARSLLSDKPIGGTGVCVSYSSDGLTWSDESLLVMDTGDLTDGDCILIRREPATGKWVAFFRPRTHPKRRYVGNSESNDFDHWTYPRMLLTPDSQDEDSVEFYGAGIELVADWGAGPVYVFHNNPLLSPMTNELVYSWDGLHYRRAMPGRSFIPPGRPGSFDRLMIEPFTQIKRGSEIFIYYKGSTYDNGSDRFTGLKELTKQKTLDGEPFKHGLGVARLP